MAYADVHCFDHRTGERSVASGDLWNGRWWWMTDSQSNDRYRSRLIYGDQSEKYVENTQIVNLITVEKIVCNDNVVYEEELYDLPPQVVSLLVVMDKLETLQNQSQQWRETTAEVLRQREAEVFKLRDAFVILAHVDIAYHFRTTMALAAKISQLMVDKSDAATIEAATCEFDDAIYAFKNFVDDTCGPYAEMF